MAFLYFDNFTDANGTLIHNHTADTGQSYDTNAGFKVQDNRLYCDDVTDNYVEIIGAADLGDYFTVTANFRKVSDAGNMGFVVGGITNGWLVRITSGQSLQLWKISGGGFSNQGNYVFSAADGTDLKITFERENGVTFPDIQQIVKVSLDDVVRIQPVEQAHAIDAKLGFRCNSVISSTTGYHIDDITYFSDTPPYPEATYTVDVDANDVNYLQLMQATSGHFYTQNKGARVQNGRVFFDNVASGELPSYVQVLDATCDTEYDIDLDVYRHTDAGNIGVVFGADAALDKGWLLRASTSSGVQLWEYTVSPTKPNTLINTYTHSTGDGATLPAIKAEVRSGQIEVFVGGVSRFTHTTATSKEGNLLLRGNSVVNASTGYHLDSITYTAVTNGAGGPLVYNDTFTNLVQGSGSGTLEIVNTAVADAHIVGQNSTTSGTATVDVGISGSIAFSTDASTFVGAGSFAVSGNINATTDSTVLVGTGQGTLAGSINFSTTNSTLVGAGFIPAQGSINATLDNTTLAGSGVLVIPITGSISTTLDSSTLVGSGFIPITGSLNAILDATVLVGAGITAQPDTEPPVITVTGSSTVFLPLGGTYTELGATWTDNVDGSGSATVGGDTVDTGTSGVYVVTYDHTDAAGNPAIQQTRTVTVSNVSIGSTQRSLNIHDFPANPYPRVSDIQIPLIRLKRLVRRSSPAVARQIENYIYNTYLALRVTTIAGSPPDGTTPSTVNLKILYSIFVDYLRAERIKVLHLLDTSNNSTIRHHMSRQLQLWLETQGWVFVQT